MNFSELKQGIQTLSESFRQNAALSVNTHLTVRNWLIGFYIVEFEQNGEDRAKYGAKLLQNLADGFDEYGLSVGLPLSSNSSVGMTGSPRDILRASSGNSATAA